MSEKEALNVEILDHLFLLLDTAPSNKRHGKSLFDIPIYFTMLQFLHVNIQHSDQLLCFISLCHCRISASID